jgi:hypothetical protein
VSNLRTTISSDEHEFEVDFWHGSYGLYIAHVEKV